MLGQNGQMAEATLGGDLVKETTTATFRQDVIAESARQPVLVDFWAPWCGPCKQLTPVIEKAVKSAAGKVKLVKMNIDDHPQIAGQLGIQSIPAVIAFQRGQPVDGFMGALPESQIKQFIERLVGPLAGENDTLLEEAAAAFAAGNFEGAAQLFSEALQADPESVAAVAGLARSLVELNDIDQARDVLALAPPGSEKDAGLAAARASLELAEQAASLGDLADLVARVRDNADDHQARFDLALGLNARGQREEAASALLEVIKRDRAWNEDGARKQLVQFFEAWGPMDPHTANARRKLSTLLFS
jgi:putative thioredoxin